MEREIKLLKDKVQDLSQENVALREINVKFQLENFKLQQKVKRLESSEFDFMNDTGDEHKNNASVITFNDSTFDPTAEYLEEPSSSKKQKKPQTKPKNLRASSARKSYNELFDEDTDDLPSTSEEKPDFIKQELIISDSNSKVDEDFIPDLEQQQDSENEGVEDEDDDDIEIDPKEAATTIYKLAARRGILDKIKTLEPGKPKDSFFVNKTLDLLWDRKTLANSSARGQKCQKFPGYPVRPALDRKKLKLCRQAFVYRLKREGLSFQAREERLKPFHAMVNFKIQNSRRLLARKAQT